MGYPEVVRAVIDIGSNSVLLLLASRGPLGELDIVHDEARVARLSQGAAERGSLDTEAIARTLAVIESYIAIAREHGIEREAIVAVATEGLRMVDNPQDFLEPAAALLGRPVRLISGEEEARLSYRSVALEHPGEGELRVLDIGGASTELAVGRGLELLDSHSHRLGSVRLSERFVVEHPPRRDALAEMEDTIRATLASQPLEPLPELHGLAGTVTTCASLLLGLRGYDRDRVDGSRFAMQRIRELRDELATWPLARLQAEPMLGVGRADLVVAGATILWITLEHCGADTLVVRDRGLRYALV
jgi:exopolyphosphatase/guanosine-5'-triphosphate,3'-diphosphate pyrophosphatase